MSKPVFVPATVLALADDVRKDIPFITQSIADEHGGDSNISPRMLRFGLAEAHAAIGGRPTSRSVASALLYFCSAHANGQQSLSSLTARPCPKWAAKALTAQYEGIKPGGGCSAESLSIAALALLDHIVSLGARPKRDTATASATDASATDAVVESPTNPAIPVHGTVAAVAASAVTARWQRQRDFAARKIRAMRATIRAQNARIAELEAALAAGTQQSQRPARRRKAA